MFIRKLILVLVIVLLPTLAFAAIDTAAKRASACGETWLMPDGTIDAGDRSQEAGEYRGFLDSPGGSSATEDNSGAAGFFTRLRRRL